MGAVEDTLTRPVRIVLYCDGGNVRLGSKREAAPFGLMSASAGCGLLLAVRLSSVAAALTAVQLARPSTKPSAAAVRG